MLRSERVHVLLWDDKEKKEKNNDTDEEAVKVQKYKKKNKTGAGSVSATFDGQGHHSDRSSSSSSENARAGAPLSRSEQQNSNSSSDAGNSYIRWRHSPGGTGPFRVVHTTHTRRGGGGSVDRCRTRTGFARDDVFGLTSLPRRTGGHSSPYLVAVTRTL